MKIAVISSHTRSLFWFRLDMMKDFVQRGHTVIAMGSEPKNGWSTKFRESNIDYRQLYVDRNGINPFADLRTYRELSRFLKNEKPDKIFAYQAKTIIYSGLAAKLNGIDEFYPLIAGLGSIFRGKGLKNRILRAIIKVQYKAALSASKTVFFQNHDDKNEFIKHGLIKEEKTVVINGSGVNLNRFKVVELPNKPVFLFIGRLIKDKGIIEYLEACRIIKKKYPDTSCLLVGPYDSNPSAIRPNELQLYIDEGTIEYFGEQTDVRPYIAACSTYVLPSYHEGTPKTVLEAMAMGRSIITSDAPGCRETVVNGKNGFLVGAQDIEGIVEKMEFLILNPSINKSFGQEGHKIAKEKFDVNLVNDSIMTTMAIK